MGAISNTANDDLALFRKIKESDDQAFKVLFLRYYDKLYHFVVMLYKDPVLADEVVQEVFAKIWEKREELVIKASVKYYLYTCCKKKQTR